MSQTQKNQTNNNPSNPKPNIIQLLTQQNQAPLRKIKFTSIQICKKHDFFITKMESHKFFFWNLWLWLFLTALFLLISNYNNNVIHRRRKTTTTTRWRTHRKTKEFGFDFFSPKNGFFHRNKMGGWILKDLIFIVVNNGI